MTEAKSNEKWNQKSKIQGIIQLIACETKTTKKEEWCMKWN